MFKAGVKYYSQPRGQRNWNNGVALGKMVAQSSRNNDDGDSFCYELVVWIFWSLVFLVIYGILKKL
jgi:hypothetical protein